MGVRGSIVQLVQVPAETTVAELAAAGFSPGLMSAGLGMVTPAQTYLDVGAAKVGVATAPGGIDFEEAELGESAVGGHRLDDSAVAVPGLGPRGGGGGAPPGPCLPAGAAAVDDGPRARRGGIGGSSSS